MNKFLIGFFSILFVFSVNASKVELKEVPYSKDVSVYATKNGEIIHVIRCFDEVVLLKEIIKNTGNTGDDSVIITWKYFNLKTSEWEDFNY